MQGIPPGGLTTLDKARRLADSGDRKAAIELLEGVLSSHPRFAAAHYELGIYLREFVGVCIVSTSYMTHDAHVSFQFLNR